MTTIKQSDFKILEKYCLSDNLIILLSTDDFIKCSIKTCWFSRYTFQTFIHLGFPKEKF